MNTQDNITPWIHTLRFLNAGNQFPSKHFLFGAVSGPGSAGKMRLQLNLSLKWSTICYSLLVKHGYSSRAKLFPPCGNSPGCS